MKYAVYVRSSEGTKWCLIGFKDNQKDADALGKRRLQVLPRGSEMGTIRVREEVNAPEYRTKL